VGELMPPDFGAHLSQLQPVLRTRFWLWVHVLTIVASYGAFLLAWVMGNIVLFTAVHRQRHVTTAESTAIYRALQVGVVLVAAGTLLGGMWADQAWGRFWGWDPKEVWALVILLCYLVPLHLRYAGVVGPTALAGWAVYGFLSVIMSWYGVNFLLGVGKHAYATGSGFANSFSTDQVVVLGLSVVQLVVTTAQLLALRNRPEAQSG
jgi:ABC-type transport system involved in cytochrome c biogenesis permease subunit